MKSVHFRVLSLTVVSLMAIVVGQAQADTILMQDFESLDTGGLAGHDGWTVGHAAYGDMNVYSVTYGTGIATDKVKAVGMTGTWPKEKSVMVKAIAPTFAFDSADTAIEQHLIAKASDASNCIYAGLTWTFGTGDGRNHYTGAVPNVDTNSRPIFGMKYLNPYIRTWGGNEWIDSTVALTADHWYEFKLVMDFSVSGGQATLWYRDVDDANNIPKFSEAFASGKDPTPTKALDLYQSDGIYTAPGITMAEFTGGSKYIDKFWVVDPVPEPSILALLASGMIGLLAYAWRKRK